jgi:hypothetical protein
MNPYVLIVSLHLVIAILGLGPLMALALFTKRPSPSRGEIPAMPSVMALRAWMRLVRISQVGLVLMFGTGAILIGLVHGAFGRQLWMITSVALFVLLGGGAGLVQSCFKKALQPTGSMVHIGRAHRILVTMCAMVVVIAWLMKAKPF